MNPIFLFIFSSSFSCFNYILPLACKQTKAENLPWHVCSCLVECLICSSYYFVLKLSAQLWKWSLYPATLHDEVFVVLRILLSIYKSFSVYYVEVRMWCPSMLKYVLAKVGHLIKTCLSPLPLQARTSDSAAFLRLLMIHLSMILLIAVGPFVSAPSGDIPSETGLCASLPLGCHRHLPLFFKCGML